MTPRQIAAWLHFADQRERAADIRRLQIIAIGSQGDKKAIEAFIKTLDS